MGPQPMLTGVLIRGGDRTRRAGHVRTRRGTGQAERPREEPSLRQPGLRRQPRALESASAVCAKASAVLCHGSPSRLMQVSEQKALEGPSGGSRYPLPTVTVVVVIDVRGSSGHSHRPENRQNRTCRAGGSRGPKAERMPGWALSGNRRGRGMETGSCPRGCQRRDQLTCR